MTDERDIGPDVPRGVWTALIWFSAVLAGGALGCAVFWLLGLAILGYLQWAAPRVGTGMALGLLTLTIAGIIVAIPAGIRAARERRR